MTHISATDQQDYCEAIRGQLNALADRLSDVERHSVSSPDRRLALEAELCRLEALVARTEFADAGRWRLIATELDDRLGGLQAALRDG